MDERRDHVGHPVFDAGRLRAEALAVFVDPQRARVMTCNDQAVSAAERAVLATGGTRYRQLHKA